MGLKIKKANKLLKAIINSYENKEINELDFKEIEDKVFFNLIKYWYQNRLEDIFINEETDTELDEFIELYLEH